MIFVMRRTRDPAGSHRARVSISPRPNLRVGRRTPVSLLLGWCRAPLHPPGNLYILALAFETAPGLPAFFTAISYPCMIVAFFLYQVIVSGAHEMICREGDCKTYSEQFMSRIVSTQICESEA
jgi:hypothetical protein